MNNQPNCYGDKNVAFSNLQYDLMDEIANIKPSLDPMINIDKTDLDRAFLENLNEIPEENLLGSNLNGNNSPIANQINNLKNEEKLNGNIIVMTTDDNSNNYESIDMNELPSEDIEILEKKLAELENKSKKINSSDNANNRAYNANNRANNANDSANNANDSANNANDNANNANDSANNANDSANNANDSTNNVNDSANNANDSTNNVNDRANNVNVSTNDSNINKTFRDLIHTTRTNKIVLLLFLIIMGILFAVYKQEIKKMLS